MRLIPPAYVKPYVKRQKNDATDAEAICEAVTRANMRFVPTKTPEQQGGLVLHRTRHLFIRQQTAVINAIRAAPSCRVRRSLHRSGATVSRNCSFPCRPGAVHTTRSGPWRRPSGRSYRAQPGALTSDGRSRGRAAAISTGARRKLSRSVGCWSGYDAAAGPGDICE
jgi:hypothetical protein